MTIMVDMDRMAFTDAARLRVHRWFGVDMGARELVLWGSSIELGRQDRVRTLRDRLVNSRLLSAFDLSEEALGRYARVMKQERPEKIFGYASAIYLFARHLERVGWKANGGWPRAVFTTAEPLYDYQRATIEAVFDCPISVEYGCRETGFVAAECPSGGLHIAAEGLVVEAVDGGELVLTHLHSYAMPMIRYRTGDVGALEPTSCPCGRGLPRLRSVEGRRTDFLVTPSGRVMHALAPIYILRECPEIREFQIIQETIDHVTVTVVPEADLPAPAVEMLRSRLGRLFDGEIAVDVVRAEAIARPPSGKHRYVISKVADSYLGLPAAAPRD